MVNICRNNRKGRVSLGPNFFLSGTVHWERGRNWVNSYANNQKMTTAKIRLPGRSWRQTGCITGAVQMANVIQNA